MDKTLNIIIDMTVQHDSLSNNLTMGAISLVLVTFTFPNFDTFSKMIHFDEVHYGVLIINSMIVFVGGKIWNYLDRKYQEHRGNKKNK